jgi:hypothetical protein
VRIAGVFILLLVSLVPIMAKEKKPKQAEMSGWITDLECARKSVADATAPTHAACARKCSSDGKQLAFVTDSDHHLYAVENSFIVRGMEGEWVTAIYLPSENPDAVRILSIVPKHQ